MIYNKSKHEYEVLRRSMDEAKNDIMHREQRLAHMFDVAEKDLALLGVTAIEDKLQEDVAETLKMLRKAGIKGRQLEPLFC